MSTELVEPAVVAEVKPLTKARAQKLTDDIIKAAGSIPKLITEAFEGQAWKALDYESWETYVAANFNNMTRNGAWRNVVQGRAMRELETIAGAPVEVSAREVIAIGKRLPEVLEQIRTETANVAEAERVASVREHIANEAATLRARNTATPVVHQGLPRPMTPAWIQPAWPLVLRCAAFEGSDPYEWVLKVVLDKAASMAAVLPPEPEVEKPQRGRPRQSAGAPKEADRDTTQAGEADDGAQQASDPFGAG